MVPWVEGDGEEWVLSVRPFDDHPPLGLGEGVLDNDMCELWLGVPGIGVRERGSARGLSPHETAEVGWALVEGSLNSSTVGCELPEGRRRGCCEDSGVARVDAHQVERELTRRHE
jgi:hypothetical protein